MVMKNVVFWCSVYLGVHSGLFPSHPKEVCSVVLDADCMRPVHTECNAVAPSPECQLVLRHFFNNSGVYCINVSMTNDFSLAVTSARVNVNMGMLSIFCVCHSKSIIFQIAPR